MPDSFETPWTVAHQAPLSMGFPRQDYWGGLPFSSPEIFLIQVLNPLYLGLLHWQADSLLMIHRGSPQIDEVIKGTFICPLGKCIMHVCVCVWGGVHIKGSTLGGDIC